MQTKPQTFAAVPPLRGLAAVPDPRPDTVRAAAFESACASAPQKAGDAASECDDVGRFVLWLRDHYDPGFRVLLAAQAVASEALRRLGADSMGQARWEALGLGDVLLSVQATTLPVPTSEVLRLVGFALTNYLYSHGHVGAHRRWRLARRVRFARLNP